MLLWVGGISYLYAEEGKPKNASTQQVGGLLFDVDEGVKVEKGGGGSVYIKSNREYMEEKFKEIDGRLETLEKRVDKLEAGSRNMGKSTDKKSAQENTEDNSGKRVLVT